jgi:hypothetical protein
MVYLIFISRGITTIAKLVVDDISYEDLCWDLAKVQAAGLTTEIAQAIPSENYSTQLQ